MYSRARIMTVLLGLAGVGLAWVAASARDRRAHEETLASLRAEGDLPRAESDRVRVSGDVLGDPVDGRSRVTVRVSNGSTWDVSEILLRVDVPTADGWHSSLVGLRSRSVVPPGGFETLQFTTDEPGIYGRVVAWRYLGARGRPPRG